MSTHPEKWYIQLTPENYDEVKAWWLTQVEGSVWPCGHLRETFIVLSKHPIYQSHYWSGSEKHLIEKYPSYQKITLEQFRAITNPLPEHWYIEVTEENIEELNRWRLSKRTIDAQQWDYRFVPGATLLSEHPEDDGSYFWSKGATTTVECTNPEYKPITLEQFRQITNSTPTQKPMTKSIQISRNLLNEYYEAATEEQKAYLAEHFKLDGTTTDEAIRQLYEMACSTWKPRIKKNHPECFSEDSKYFDFSAYASNFGNRGVVEYDVAELLGLSNDFIQIRGSGSAHQNRSFFLTPEYDWELVQDGYDKVLIPTKKQKF